MEVVRRRAMGHQSGHPVAPPSIVVRSRAAGPLGRAHEQAVAAARALLDAVDTGTTLTLADVEHLVTGSAYRAVGDRHPADAPALRPLPGEPRSSHLDAVAVARGGCIVRGVDRRSAPVGRVAEALETVHGAPVTVDLHVGVEPPVGGNAIPVVHGAPAAWLVWSHPPVNLPDDGPVALRRDLGPGAVPSARDLLDGLATEAVARRDAVGARVGSRAVATLTGLDLLRRLGAATVRVSVPGGVFDGRSGPVFAGAEWAVAGSEDLLARLVAGPVPTADLAWDDPVVPATLDALARAGVLAVDEPADVVTAVPTAELLAPVSAPLATAPPPWPGGAVHPGTMVDTGRAALADDLAARLGGWRLDAAIAAGVPSTTRVDPGWCDGAAEVDRLLRWGDVDPALVAVARAGEPRNLPAPADLFHRDVDGGPVVVDAVAVADLVEGGSTLIVRAVDRRVAPFADLLADIERVLGRRCGANVYISRGDAPGFGAHWDDHDVLVVQLAGSKGWTVLEPAAERPEVPHDPAAVSGRVAWAGELRTGDALFVPRGWGHRVEGRDDLSIHLTVSMPGVLVHDVLVAEAARADTDVAQRRDVPVDASPPVWQAPAAPAAVASYQAFWAARVPARPAQRLWSDGTGTRTVRWIAAGTSVDDSGRLVAGDRTVPLSDDARALVERLLAGPVAAGDADADVLGALVGTGLVVVEAAP